MKKHKYIARLAGLHPIDLYNVASSFQGLCRPTSSLLA